MQKIIFYMVASLCFVVSKINAQETFEERAKTIAQNIEAITKDGKQALKDRVDFINKELESGTINAEQADKMKMEAATLQAKKIEESVAVEQAKLTALVQEKVEGRIASRDTLKGKRYLSVSLGNSKNKIPHEERRTTSQFVFAAGVNNLVTDGAVAHSDYRYWGSHFYEWGVTWNSRILKNHNLLHAKYGVSLMYNNLRPTDNRYFVESGNQTLLVTSAAGLKDSRFRTVSLVVPLHLEFDFSKNKAVKDSTTTSFRTHQSIRFGIGGFAGVNIKSKQITKFTENDHDYTVRDKADFNTNYLTYGVSTYIGYKQTSLYMKYDLNPLFGSNPVKQNNISLGLRFDFN